MNHAEITTHRSGPKHMIFEVTVFDRNGNPQGHQTFERDIAKAYDWAASFGVRDYATKVDGEPLCGSDDGARQERCFGC